MGSDTAPGSSPGPEPCHCILSDSRPQPRRPAAGEHVPRDEEQLHLPRDWWLHPHEEGYLDEPRHGVCPSPLRLCPREPAHPTDFSPGPQAECVCA